MPFPTVEYTTTGTYTEPPGSYGQPVGAVVTTVSSTRPFAITAWAVAGAGAVTSMQNQVTQQTSAMRQLGQTFSAYTVTATGRTRLYKPVVPT